MRIRSSKDKKDTPNAVDKLFSATQQSYRKFEDYVAFRDDDPVWMLSYKLIMRFVGILFAIMISPFVIIALIVAIMVVL